MPTHDTVTRNAIADLVVDALDVGSLNAEARLKVYTSNRTILLATILLANPSFAAAASGVAAALSLPLADSLADATGLANVFDCLDRDENVVFSGTVGTSDADMIVPTLEINTDDIVKIIGFNYTAPP